MKRELLLFCFFILLFFEAQSQYKYRVQYDITLKDPILMQSPPYSLTSYDAEVRLDGIVVYQASAISSQGDNYQKKDFIIELDEKLTEITTYSSFNGSADEFPECASDPYRSITIDYNENNCYTNMASFPPCIDIRSSYFKVTPYEEPLIVNVPICLSENISIPLNDCSNYSHEWEYSINNENYKNDLPIGSYSKELDMLVSEIPNIKVGDIVRFRMKFSEIESWTVDFTKTSYSNIFSYVVTDCSPKLNNPPEPIDITCNGSQDGSVKVTFDRALEAGKDERMLVYPLKLTDAGEWDPVAPQVILLADDLDANNSYTLPKEIVQPGTYKLAWISKYGIDPTTNPNSDEQSTEFVINEPEPITATVAITNVKCKGGNNGSIRVNNAKGGNSGYRYSIDNQNWQTSNIFSNLTAGTYTIYIKDAKGCSVSFPEQKVTEPSQSPVISIGTSKNPTYPGKSDGFINIVGKLGYTYQWTKNGVNYATTEDIDNLGGGTYIVVAKDANGCISNSLEYKLEAPDELAIGFSIVPEEIKCYGQTANITANVTGGTAPYAYQWSTGETERYIYDKGEGSYTLTVTDTYNNKKSVTYTLDAPEPIKVTEEKVTQILCKGAKSGEISLTIEGGTLPYKVYWTSNDPSFEVEGTAISNLPPGFYYYEIRDANATDGESNGCTFNNNSNPIEITEPYSRLQVTENPDVHKDNNIYEGSSGELQIEVTGGTEPYTSYEWAKVGDPSFTPPVGSTDTHLVDLEAGSYQVTVTDENGCTALLPEPIIITQPEALLIPEGNVATTHVECNGFSTGSISVTATGGIDPYHYVWEQEGNPDFVSEGSPIMENLPAGNYRVTVTDESGSKASYTTPFIEITQPEPIRITATEVTDNLCYNDTQGAINITVSGGTGTYTYEWSNGATTEDIENLMSGDYTVTITDENSCEYTEIIHVGQPEDALALKIDDHKNITGFGWNDGEISITVSGGTPPYSYEWFSDNGFTFEEEDIVDLEPGHYTLVVKDANADAGNSNNCSIMQEFEIIEPEELLVSIKEIVSLECNGDSDGELYAEVEGGIKPYGYEWFKEVDGIMISMGQTASEAFDLNAGSYMVTITDDNGVSKNAAIHQLTEPEALIITVENVQDVLCYGEATGSIDLTISGGTPPYNINWDNGKTIEDISGLSSGSYTVEVYDNNGCSISETVDVEDAYDLLELTNVEIADVSAYRGTDGAISLDIVGGLEPYNITWTRLDDNSFIGNTASINNLIHGNYQIEITDVNGCRLTDEFVVIQPDIVEATIMPPTCHDGSDGSISLVVNDGVGDYTYQWDTGEATAAINNLSPGDYTVTILGYYDEVIKRTYTVENTAPVVVDLGEDLTTLCIDQQRTLDATIDDPGATYQWSATNGFTANSAQITVEKAGVYTVLVTNSKGCLGTDSVEIKESPSEIGVEFFVSSQVFVGERFLAVDVTSPVPDSIEWLLSDEAQVVSKDQDQTELYFEQSGSYEMTMVSYVGDCEAYQTKKITVLANDGSVTETGEDTGREMSYEEFMVYPNPTRGQFTVSITLKERGDISLRVFNLANNSVVAHQKGSNRDSYEMEFDISSATPGMYALVLETASGNSVRKLIKG